MMIKTNNYQTTSKTKVVFPYTIFDGNDEQKVRKKVIKEIFHENFY